MSKQVIVYSKPGCMPCQFTKKFLEQHHIPFEERDITTNEKWAEEVRALGYQSLPVVYRSEEENFHGFQPERLGQMVG